MIFEVEGKFKVDGEWMSFRKKIEANNKKTAIEKTYSLIGSNHKVKRNLIRIDEVRKVE